MMLLPLLLIPGLVMCAKHRRQDQLSQEVTTRLERMIQETRECRSIPGLTLTLVSTQRGTLLSKGYGYTDIEAEEMVNDHTLFCVASLSKAFTSTLLGLLLYNSSRTWDTPIHEILRDCEWFADRWRSQHITTRDLLLHRTGIPRYDMLWFAGDVNKDSLVSRIPCMEAEADPRTANLYNNNMYSLAGRVAEALSGTGQSWEDLVTEHILKPLGMDHTTFYHYPREAHQHFATQYTYDDDGGLYRLDAETFKGVAAIAPAIAICSNAEDMAKWMQAHLSASRTNASSSSSSSSSILQRVMRETHETMTASSDYCEEILPPRTPVSWSLGGYGLAWYTGKYRDWPIISHYGSFPGYYSMLTLVPDLDLALFSSINGGMQNFPYTIHSLLHSYIVDLVQGEDPWLEEELKFGCYFPQKAPTIRDRAQSGIPPPDSGTDTATPQLAQYQGVYYHRVFGNITITVNGNSSQLQAQYGNMRFTLYPMTRDTFHGVPDDYVWMHLVGSTEMAFTLDGTGNTALSVTLNNFPTQPVFHRSHQICQPTCNGVSSKSSHQVVPHKLLILCHSTVLAVIIFKVAMNSI